jgi:hypothetical protein
MLTEEEMFWVLMMKFPMSLYFRHFYSVNVLKV